MTYSIQTNTGHVFLTATNIDDARTWITYTWNAEEAFRINPLTDREVVNVIAKYYDSGWDAFLADSY